MQRSELPRDDSGSIIGPWKLRHRSADFTQSFGVVNFVCGESTAPVYAHVIDRMMATFGEDLSAEPWPEPVDATPAESASAVVTATQQPSASGAPTTRGELAELSESALRALVEEMGESDGARVWKIGRMRRFIADELGIEGA